jgi:hypothetical protein
MKSLTLFKNKRLALGKFLNGPLSKEDVMKSYVRCFNSRDGQMVLEHLHHITLFRVTDPLMDSAGLRQLEGQRQLVLFICQQMAKGQKGMA